MIRFHRLLIATAIAFCAGMTWWGILAWRANDGVVAPALSAGFALAGVLLAYYLRNLRRFLGR